MFLFHALRYLPSSAFAPGQIGDAVPKDAMAAIASSLDWLYASFLAASNQLVAFPMGSNWYIINYYVPAIGVAHVLIFARLLKESHALETSTVRLTPG